MFKNGWLVFFVSFGGCCLSTAAWAISFGSFDPRAIAMGGAGVAVATPANAVYYNPALLAKYQEKKETGKNTQLVFPTATLRQSNNINKIDDFSQQRYQDRIDAAVVAFNANDAAALLAATDNLQQDMNDIANDPLALDSNFGLVVAVPTAQQGGAFMINQRLLMDGKLSYTDADRLLLNKYREEAAQGSAATPLHPELYDANGLINPRDLLSSSAAATAVSITELSMAISVLAEIDQTPLLVGLTPKFVKVTTYDAESNAATNDLTDYTTDHHPYAFNYDLGVAYEYHKRWSTGLVAKNLKQHDYVTGLGHVVKFKPQFRAGLGFRSESFGTYAADIDLRENAALSRGDPSQMLALGGEWRRGWLMLRGGLAKNLAASGQSGELLYSGGIHGKAGRWFADAGMAYNSYQTGLALQVGSRF